MTTGVTTVTSTTTNPGPIQKIKSLATRAQQQFQANPAKTVMKAAAMAFVPAGLVMCPGAVIGAILGGQIASTLGIGNAQQAAAAGNAAKGAIKAGQIGAEAVKKVSGTKKPQGDAQNEDNKHHFDRKA